MNQAQQPSFHLPLDLPIKYIKTKVMIWKSGKLFILNFQDPTVKFPVQLISYWLPAGLNQTVDNLQCQGGLAMEHAEGLKAYVDLDSSDIQDKRLA